MKKVFVLNQSKEFISKNKNLEVVSVVAEQTEETNFKSYAEKKAEEIRDIINEVLALKYKNYDFKVLVITDENFSTYKIEKVIVLLDGFINNKSVIDSLTESLKSFNIKFGLLTDKFEPRTISKFQSQCQFLANEIQKYLVNIKNFKGITKINASKWHDIEIFDITVSGRGTDDLIVNKIKKLSDDIKIKNNIEYTKDDIFIMLDNLFER